MKVKMLTSMAGPTHNWDHGSEYDIPDKEAKRLIDAGFAVPVAGNDIETTMREPPEKRKRVK